jgi:hypothetical protein
MGLANTSSATQSCDLAQIGNFQLLDYFPLFTLFSPSQRLREAQHTQLEARVLRAMVWTFMHWNVTVLAVGGGLSGDFHVILFYSSFY